MIRLTLLIAVLVANTANAGGFYYPRTYQRRYVKSYAQPVYQFYLVGQPVRIEAMARAELESHPMYQMMQALAQRAEQDPEFFQRLTQALEGPQIPEGALPQQLSKMEQSCIRCHSGPEPKGGHDFTGAIDADQLKALKAAILEDRMPPPSSPERKDWGPDGAGAVLSEAVDRLESNQPNIVPPVPEPPTQ